MVMRRIGIPTAIAAALVVGFAGSASAEAESAQACRITPSSTSASFSCETLGVSAGGAGGSVIITSPVFLAPGAAFGVCVGADCVAASAFVGIAPGTPFVVVFGGACAPGAGCVFVAVPLP